MIRRGRAKHERSGRKRGCAVVVGSALLCFSVAVYAGGYTAYAQPREIEVINNGLLIYGPFGNVMSCGYANAVFHPATHQNYNVVAAMAMTAMASGKAMAFYVFK